MFKVGLAGLALTLCLLLGACDISRNKAIADYQTLCEIYDEALTLEDDNMNMILHMLERIETEIPNVYKHYENLTMVDPDRVYATTQQIAKYETGEKWECPSMEAFYSGGTD